MIDWSIVRSPILIYEASCPRFLRFKGKKGTMAKTTGASVRHLKDIYDPRGTLTFPTGIEN
jgi:hypothetical protein